MILGASPLGAVPFGACPSVGAYAESLADIVGVNDALADELLALLIERIAYGHAVGQQINAAMNPADGFSLDDLTSAFWGVVAADGTGFNDTLAPSAIAINAVADGMVVTGAATDVLHALSLLAEAFAIDDAFRSVYDSDLGDGVSFDDTLAHILEALCALSDGAGFDDVQTPTALISIPLQDDASFAESVTTTAQVGNALSDTVPMFVTLQIAGGTFSGFVMNTETKGVTDYTNFPFESFAKVGNSYYGARADGIYLLEGDDDDGDQINGRVRTAMLNLLRGKMARVPEAYLGYTSAGHLTKDPSGADTYVGQLVMKVVVTGQTGIKEEWWYELTAQTATAPREGRIKFGRGLKSVYWQFELHNKAGDDFSLDVLQLHALTLDRRI